MRCVLQTLRCVNIAAYHRGRCWFYSSRGLAPVIKLGVVSHICERAWLWLSVLPFATSTCTCGQTACSVLFCRPTKQWVAVSYMDGSGLVLAAQSRWLRLPLLWDVSFCISRDLIWPASCTQTSRSGVNWSDFLPLWLGFAPSPFSAGPRSNLSVSLINFMSSG